MNIDIPTLAIFLSITNILQVIALFAEYRANKTYCGLGWWTLGSAAWALAFISNYLRDSRSIGLIAIVVNNSLFVAGAIFIYIGILRFFSRREKRGWLIAFWLSFTLIFIYFTLLKDDLTARRITISIALGSMSFGIARALFFHKTRSVSISADFLIIAFLANGILCTISALVLITGGTSGGVFATSLAQIAIYLDALFISTMWTFGFILLINQRLNAESREAKEHFELVFNTSPDAIFITRVADMHFVDINEGFTSMSGFTHSEIIGKTSQDINIWHSQEDQQKFFAILKDKGACEGFQAEIRCKDGSIINGIISAKIVHLQGGPRIINVIRDTTERTQYDQKIKQLVHQLEVERNYAQTNALTDSLTMLVNRRYFDESLNKEFYRQKRSGAPLSLIILDLDNFKEFNDRYGHLAGDDCLRKVAAALKAAAGRKSDIVARYGGEEFAVILPETDHLGAASLAESLRRSVEELAIPISESDSAGVLTISLGVVTVSTTTLTASDQLIDLADAALYRAKKGGRNRFEVATPIDGTQEARSQLVRLVWRPSAECGNTTIDGQHKKLFEASNNLLSAIIDGRSKDECNSLMEKVLTDILDHFRDEEAILLSAGFPLVEEHAKSHKDLVAKATLLAERYKGDELALGELFSFLAYDVIAQHMFIEDRNFFPYI